MTALLEAADPRAEYDRRNEQLIRDLDRLDAASLRRIIARVNELRGEVLDRLASLPTTTFDGEPSWQPVQLRTFQAELEQAAGRFGDRLRAELSDTLRQSAALGLSSQAALSDLAVSLGEPRIAVGYGVQGLLDQQVAVAVLHSADLIKAVERDLIVRVNREVQAAIFGGQSIHDATMNVRAILATEPRWLNDLRRFGTIANQAETIMRTEMIRVYGLAQEHVLRDSADELPGLMKEWHAVLDARIDPLCSALDGKRVKPGEPFPGGYQHPPAHPRCRCSIQAWLPEWENA